MEKAATTRRVVFAGILGVKLKKKPVKFYILSIALCGAGTWTLQKVDQKYLESFEIWCWRRMEKISWTDRVRNEGVLHRDKGERKANSYSYRWRGKCFRKKNPLKE